MSIAVSTEHNANDVVVLTLAVSAPLVPMVLRLDCSLQRHSYLYLDGASAKVVNSILHFDILAVAVAADLESVGKQLKVKLEALLRLPSNQRDAFGNQVLQDAGGLAQNANGNLLEAAIGGTLFGDYTADSKRVYRVDNVAINRTRPPNHCYPISGPDLWANVSQTAFAAAATLRRLQLEMRRYPGNEKPGWLAEKWKSLQYVGPAAGNTTYAAISGARTQIKAASEIEQAKLIEVSNVGWLVKQVIGLG